MGKGLGYPIAAREEAASQGHRVRSKPELPRPVGQLVSVGEKKKEKKSRACNVLGHVVPRPALGLGGGALSSSCLRVAIVGVQEYFRFSYVATVAMVSRWSVIMINCAERGVSENPALCPPLLPGARNYTGCPWRAL